MVNAVKWTSPTNVTSPISAQTVNSGAGSLGSEYDNETNKNQFAAFELRTTHGTAPTANSVWHLYILYALDGTNYEEDGATTQPKKSPVASFPVRNSTSQQAWAVSVPILPFKFKPVAWNATDQNSSATATTLDMEVFNDEIQ